MIISGNLAHPFDRPAKLCTFNLHEALSRLDRSTRFIQVHGALGGGDLEERNEDEAMLVYQREGHTLEFEFLPGGGLARFNLFPQ